MITVGSVEMLFRLNIRFSHPKAMAESFVYLNRVLQTSKNNVVISVFEC